MKPSRWTAIVFCCAVAFAGLAPTSSAEEPLLSTYHGIDCTPIPAVSETSYDAVTGQERSTTRRATRVSYADGGWTVIPPAGWRPKDATPEELEAYGFPVRPDDVVDAQNWDETWGRYTDTLKSEPCVFLGVSALPISYSEIWSGLLDSCAVGGCTRASGVFVQKSFNINACGTSPRGSHVTWVGLGGYGNSQLLQTGTNENRQAWYEAIAPNNKDIFLTLFNTTRIPAGHVVQADAIFNPSNGRARFQVMDITTGYRYLYETGIFQNRKGSGTFTAAESWSGRSAEYIDERATVNGSPTPYLPNSDEFTYWSSAWTDAWSNRYRSDNPTFAPRAISMRKGTKILGNIRNYTTNPANGAFTVDWQACS